MKMKMILFIGVLCWGTTLPSPLAAQSSLSQFVYDVTMLDGADAALDTFVRYEQSPKFYANQDEFFKCAQLFFRMGQKESALKILGKAEQRFSKLKTSAALNLFYLAIEKAPSTIAKWIEKNANKKEYYYSAFELNEIGMSLMAKKKYEAAKLVFQLNLDKNPTTNSAYERLGEAYVALGNQAKALATYQKGLDLNDQPTLIKLALGEQLPYQATVLPKDTTQLFVSEGKTNSQMVFIFVQGGPLPTLGIYGNDPLLNFGSDDFLRVHVKESQIINPTILAAKPKMTAAQAVAEHQLSAEILHRTVKYFKGRGKTVYVVGHSYGCSIGLEYLRTKEDLADGLILMGSDLDEDLRNYEEKEKGGTFIRWQNGIEPYEKSFYGDFILGTLFQEALFRGLDNVKLLVSSNHQQRYTELLKGRDLSKVIFMYGRFDEANGRTQAREVEFWRAHGAQVRESYGDHHSMLAKPYLSTVYEHLTQGKILKKSVASMLAQASAAHEFDFALASYQENPSSNLYHPLDENEINNLGYELLGQGKKQEALAVFKLNVAAFPDHWNTHDSLAETYLLLGNKRLGIKHYQTSLSLHPGNLYAIKALREQQK